MDRLVDVAGNARLVLLDPPPSLARTIARRLAPYPLVTTSRATVEAGVPDVVLEAVPAAEPAPRFVEQLGDTGDGLVTAWDGSALHLLAAGSSCELPHLAESGPLRFRYRPGFPVWSILGPILGPVLHGAVRERDAVVVHGSAVEIDGEAVVLAGWSESGKTETALALAVGGSRLLSDKWTVLGPGGATADEDGRPAVLPFPSPLSIRRWLVDALPELRVALPSSARVQFAVAALAASAADAARLDGRAAGGPGGGLVLGALRRTLALGERTSLSMARLREVGLAAEAPTRERPLRALILLTATPPERAAAGKRAAPEVGPADGRWAARRLARSAQAERRTWNDLVGRMGYAGERSPGERRHDDARPHSFSSDPGRAELWQPDAVRIAEEERLAWLLEGVPVVQIAAPFPGDPRAVADAVRSALTGLPNVVRRPPVPPVTPPPLAPERIGEVA